MSIFRAVGCWFTTGYWPNGDTTLEILGDFLYGLRPDEVRRRKARAWFRKSYPGDYIDQGGMRDDPEIAPPPVDPHVAEIGGGYGDYLPGLPVTPLSPTQAPLCPCGKQGVHR